VINGRIVKEGDAVDGKEVYQIRPESVILKQGKTKYVVRMRGVGSSH
jgi:hypothetical protein